MCKIKAGLVEENGRFELAVRCSFCNKFHYFTAGSKIDQIEKWFGYKKLPCSTTDNTLSVEINGLEFLLPTEKCEYEKLKIILEKSRFSSRI